MASACIQLFFVGIPKAVPAADVFPPKPLQIHLVYIAPKDLPRAYALCANVGVASVGHERTKGESRGLFARYERTTAAAAAVNELLSPLELGSAHDRDRRLRRSLAELDAPRRNVQLLCAFSRIPATPAY